MKMMIQQGTPYVCAGMRGPQGSGAAVGGQGYVGSGAGADVSAQASAGASVRAAQDAGRVGAILNRMAELAGQGAGRGQEGSTRQGVAARLGALKDELYRVAGSGTGQAAGAQSAQARAARAKADVLALSVRQADASLPDGAQEPVASAAEAHNVAAQLRRMAGESAGQSLMAQRGMQPQRVLQLLQ